MSRARSLLPARLRRPRSGDRNRTRSSGQALVEFAFIVPFFFILLLGIIEAGRFIYHYQMLNDATRSGARYAIINGSNAACPTGPLPPGVVAPICHDPLGNNVRRAVSDAAFGLVSTGDLTIPGPTYVPANNGRGSQVTVLVSYTYSPIVPVLPPITISAESTLVVNN
jgi:hypothetical protein